MLAAKWVKSGFFELANPSKKAGATRLAARCEAMVSQGEGGSLGLGGQLNGG